MLATLLLAWYDGHKRVLPFRGTKDPYRIWLSEIMLQQTRTETVGAYYERFLSLFPDVFALARAEEQAVLKAEEYLDFMSFSRSGLIDQLEFEGFTYDQASAAATAVGL